MNEIYETPTDEEVIAIAESNHARWPETFRLLADRKCENGECPECAAEQARGY